MPQKKTVSADSANPSKTIANLLAIHVAGGPDRLKLEGRLGDGDPGDRQDGAHSSSPISSNGRPMRSTTSRRARFPAAVPDRAVMLVLAYICAFCCRRPEPVARPRFSPVSASMPSAACLQDLRSHAPALLASSRAAHGRAFAIIERGTKGNRDDRPLHDPQQRADTHRVSATAVIFWWGYGFT